MKVYCYDKEDVVLSVAELSEHLRKDSPLTMTITPEKSGDFFATIAIEGLSEDIVKTLDWNILGRLSRT